MWTSRNGKFSVKAKLVKVENGTVTLETPKGKKIEVHIEKLSDEDQEFIEKRENEPSSAIRMICRRGALRQRNHSVLTD